MAKVKEQIDIEVEGGTINVLFYCDDDEGYGVEILDDNSTIEDFSFGDDKDFTYKFFQCIADLLKEDDNAILEKLSPLRVSYPTVQDLPIVRGIVADWIERTGAVFL